MFNFWIYFFFCLILLSTIIMGFTQTPILLLIISEFNWICLILSSVIQSQVYGDPRYFVLTYLFLFIAAVEITLYLIYVLNKKKMFNGMLFNFFLLILLILKLCIFYGDKFLYFKQINLTNALVFTPMFMNIQHKI